MMRFVEKSLADFPFLVVEHDDRRPSVVVVCYANSYEQAYALWAALVQCANATGSGLLYGIRETAFIAAWQKL